MRLIDADRLKRQVEGRSWRAKEKFIELIDASATIKSQTVQLHYGVKHGRWEEKTVSYYRIEQWQSARCSVCGRYHTTPYLYYFTDYNHCPSCGAQMDLKEDKRNEVQSDSEDRIQ